MQDDRVSVEMSAGTAKPVASTANPMGSFRIQTQMKRASARAAENLRQSAVTFAVERRGFSCLTQRTKCRVQNIMTASDEVLGGSSLEPAHHGQPDDDHNSSEEYKNGGDTSADDLLMHESKVLDAILCILCLRAYPRGCFCGNRICRTLVPLCYVTFSLAFWVVMIDFSFDGTPQFSIKSGLWVACAIGHMTSTAVIVQASLNGTAEKQYFLNPESVDKVEKRTDRSMLKWFAIVGTICVVLEALCMGGILPVLADASSNGDSSSPVRIISFISLLLLLMHPQVVLNGLLEARTQDLLDNIKMCFVYMERALNRSEIDLNNCYRILAIVKKTGASVQAFSWDWQKLVVGCLAMPLCLGLLFTYYILRSVGASLSAPRDGEDEVELDDLMFLFFVFAFLFMWFCFIYTMWKLSGVAHAISHLNRVLDFGLERKHIANLEVCAIVCEVRHLVDKRGSVKLYGIQINRMFVLKILKLLLKIFSLGASVIVVGEQSAASSGSKSNSTEAWANNMTS